MPDHAGAGVRRRRRRGEGRRSRCSTTATCRTPSAGMVERRLRQVDVAPLLGQGHRRLRRGRPPPAPARRHPQGPGGVPRREPRTRCAAGCTQESPWWVPEPIDDRIFNKIFSGVQRFLADVAGRPRPRGAPVDRGAHPRTSPTACATDPVMIAKAEELKDELLSHPEVQAWFESLWGSVKRPMLDAGRRPDERAAGARRPTGCAQFGARLATDAELQAQDRRLARAHGRLRRRQLQGRGRRPHRHDRRAVGQPRHVPAHRAAGRPRPPVHPHQRHRRRRHRRPPASTPSAKLLF